ncbi:hypothetical protein NPA13_01790 [Mycoplasma sp. 2045]|uniref:hypothetical protein n=1 Tax=Mycoplasma sp. 2045 TaxID=2967301 RepID=UPI00211C85D9|nr:hypothetical protein [Mycoplasma sp. 2045]UUM20184.1 hypothetical protein NPA13_01790 [Mycoplasma sp. 2045]
MANKKLIKKFLTIGVTTSPLLLFLPSALIRVDNKEAETGDYDQINPEFPSLTFFKGRFLIHISIDIWSKRNFIFYLHYTHKMV